MSENKFKIRMLKRSSFNKTVGLKESYSHWRSYKKDTGGPFFAIYKDMKEYLSEISHGALKLYIFYGFASKNDTGDSWHAVANVAKALDVSPRTIDKWNNELEELGFIRREAAGKKSKSVFLLPLSDYVFNLGNISQLNEWIPTEEFEEVYGQPMCTINLVQVREIKKELNVKHYHILISKNKYGKLNTRHTLFKTVTRDLKIVPDIGSDVLDDNICRLEDNIELPSCDIELETECWYVNNEIKLQDDQVLLEFVLTLALNEVDKESYVVYGWKDI